MGVDRFCLIWWLMLLVSILKVLFLIFWSVRCVILLGVVLGVFRLCVMFVFM